MCTPPYENQACQCSPPCGNQALLCTPPLWKLRYTHAHTPTQTSLADSMTSSRCLPVGKKGTLVCIFLIEVDTSPVDGCQALPVEAKPSAASLLCVHSSVLSSQWNFPEGHGNPQIIKPENISSNSLASCFFARLKYLLKLLPKCDLCF